MLDKKSKLYDQKILDELKEAKRLGTKNKKEAMRHMVRKARYVKQQQQVEGQRDTLEAQVSALRKRGSGSVALAKTTTSCAKYVKHFRLFSSLCPFPLSLSFFNSLLFSTKKK